MTMFRYLLTEIQTYSIRKLFLVILFSLTCISSITSFDSLHQLTQEQAVIKKELDGINMYHFTSSGNGIMSLNAVDTEVILKGTGDILGEQPNYFATTSVNIFGASKQSKLFYQEDSPTYTSNLGEIVFPDFIELNQALYEKVGLKLFDGEGLSGDDFSTDHNNILLGYDYHQYYQVGDQIPLTIITGFEENRPLLENRDFRIKGFLEKDAEIYNYAMGSTESLDLNRRILLPLYQDQDVGILFSYFFLQGTPMNTTTGLFDQNEQINQIGKSVGINDLQIQSDQVLFQNEFASQNEKLMSNWFGYAILVFFIFMTTILIQKQLIAFRRKTYAAYFALGSTPFELVVLNFLQNILIALLGIGGAFTYLNYFSTATVSAVSIGYGLLLSTMIFLIASGIGLIQSHIYQVRILVSTLKG